MTLVNAERGTRKSEQAWRVGRGTTLPRLFRVSRSDFRVRRAFRVAEGDVR
jgi:hypothetical protein